MSTTYSVRPGDTFESISRRAYGVETNAGLIQSANPGIVEPLLPGIKIVVPDDATAPQNLPIKTPSEALDDVTLLINNRRFRSWTQVTITDSMDTMKTVSFGTPYDSNYEEFRQDLKPFQYSDMAVNVNGERFFTGTIISSKPSIAGTSKTRSVAAYSLPGILNDCTSPASNYPQEFSKQSILEIAKTLCKPFSVDIAPLIDAGEVFKRVSLDVQKKILVFLIELAKQRNLIITDTADGLLKFDQSVAPGNPVARIKQGQSPFISMVPNYNEQNFYSHITGITQTKVGSRGKQYSVKNSKLTNKVRPLVFKLKDTSSESAAAAVNAKIGRMFADAISYTLNVSTWQDPTGNLWKSNSTIKVLAPDADVVTEYEFLIKKVTFIRTPNSATASLLLVLPGAYSGEIPERLPWEEL